jgi:acyl-coenzyme A thioesterase PaaI-like protein
MPERLARWLAQSGAAAAGFAAAVRDLIHASVTSWAPPEVLDDARARTAHLTGALRAHTPVPEAPRYPHLESVTGPADVMPFDVVIGPLSPLAPPLSLASVDGRTLATVSFTAPYEGPPGCVHGGIIAACFDQVLNVANLLAGAAGPTATLEVRYRRPTPLDTPVTFEAGTPVVDGRAVRTTAVLRAGDVVTAEASGTFVLVPFDRVMALTSGRR